MSDIEKRPGGNLDTGKRLGSISEAIDLMATAHSREEAVRVFKKILEDVIADNKGEGASFTEEEWDTEVRKWAHNIGFALHAYDLQFDEDQKKIWSDLREYLEQKGGSALPSSAVKPAGQPEDKRREID